MGPPAAAYATHPPRQHNRRDVRRRAHVAITSTLVLALTTVSTIAAVVGSPTPASAASPAAIKSITPARLLDTRPGERTVDGKFAGVGRRRARSVIEVQVTGRAGIPAGAGAAMLNLTAVFPSRGTVLTAFPCGIKRPEASNLNVPAGDIRANSAFVKLSAEGSVCVYTASATDIVIDVGGYVPAGGAPVSQNPARILETRRGYSTVDEVYNGIGKLKAGGLLTLQVSERANIPADAEAVLLNVTAVFPEEGTVLTLYACDLPTRPEASNLNVSAGDIGANSVFVKLSAEGTICIYTAAATDVIVDVNGYLPAGQSLGSVFPSRMMDSRPGQHTYDGVANGTGRLGDKAVVELQIAGRGGTPKSATAAMLNVTAVTPEPGTAVTVFPCGSVPGASNLNVPAGEIRANNVFVKLSATGKVCIYTAHATDLVVDLNGFLVEPATTSMCIPSVTRLPKSECAALVAIYNATNGPTWGRLSEWATKTDPCRWQGVTCSQFHVTNLYLSSSDVSGQLPPAIADLTYLTKLDVRGTSLRSVAAEVGQLKNLQELNLVRNQLAILPDTIGDLPDLFSLDVRDNAIKTLPDSVGNLANLFILRVSDNRLTRLPDSIAQLKKLATLDARNNAMAFDVTTAFAPYSTYFAHLQVSLSGNRCLTTTDPAMASWLTSRDPLWADGC